MTFRWMLEPSIREPFVDPQSSKCHSPSRRSRRACMRETRTSGRRIWRVGFPSCNTLVAERFAPLPKVTSSMLASECRAPATKGCARSMIMTSCGCHVPRSRAVAGPVAWVDCVSGVRMCISSPERSMLSRCAPRWTMVPVIERRSTDAGGVPHRDLSCSTGGVYR